LAPPRSFDYDVLNQVMRDNPELKSRQLADIMTNYERCHCKQGTHWLQDRQCGSPDYPRIQANGISRVVSQLRNTWEEEGRPVRDRPFGRLIPWSGIPQEYVMDTSLRHLKTLALLAKGQTVTPQRERQALAFRARLEDEKIVIDITDEGRPYERPANPDELDKSGGLKKLTADVRPGWLARELPAGIERREDYLRKLEAIHERQRERQRRAS
jgi:hypothetical protein